MSMTVTVRFAGDPAQAEKVAAANPARMMRISEDAKQHGLIHHRFVGGVDSMLVIDEWESKEGFDAFFAGQSDIPALLHEAGASGEPQVEIWRAMDMKDEV